MNPKQIASVRRAISRTKNSSGRVRYSKFVKDTVTSWIVKGESPSEVSSTVGIGVSTVLAWSADVKNKFHKLEVLPTASTTRARATLPNGIRLTSPSIGLLIDALELFK